MRPLSRLFVGVGGVMGAASVAGAAWSAHAAPDIWNSGILAVAFGQLGLHGLATLAWGLGRDQLGRRRLSAASGLLLSLGALSFTAALIVAAQGGSLGLIAPTGGVAMILGWLLAAVSALPARTET